MAWHEVYIEWQNQCTSAEWMLRMNFGGYGAWHQWLAMMVNSGHVCGQDDVVTNWLSRQLMSVWWFISSIDADVVAAECILHYRVWFGSCSINHMQILLVVPACIGGLMMKMMIPKSKCNKPSKIARSYFFNNWYYWESMQKNITWKDQRKYWFSTFKIWWSLWEVIWDFLLDCLLMMSRILLLTHQDS